MSREVTAPAACGRRLAVVCAGPGDQGRVNSGCGLFIYPMLGLCEHHTWLLITPYTVSLHTLMSACQSAAWACLTHHILLDFTLLTHLYFLYQARAPHHSSDLILFMNRKGHHQGKGVDAVVYNQV